jgi:hypothetical protein
MFLGQFNAIAACPSLLLRSPYSLASINWDIFREVQCHTGLRTTKELLVIVQTMKKILALPERNKILSHCQIGSQKPKDVHDNEGIERQDGRRNSAVTTL